MTSFKHWSKMDAERHNMRVEAGRAHNKAKADFVDASAGVPVEREHDLHEDLAGYCRANGYLLLTSRFGVKSTIPTGFPDCVIFMPSACCVFLELKKRGGKATIKQQETIAYARRLGFVAEVVMSLEDAVNAMMKAIKKF